MIGRLDTGVWVAREARAMGDTFYARPAFPEVSIPAAYRQNWAQAHGIMRQESSFDRGAVSSAGARGMMQLMPATAAIEARRIGVPYNLGRLTEDPDYNVLIGSHHLTGLMDRFGGNLVFVAVAYNAGAGRVPQWIARNGDPRMPGGDMLRWIEDIPFSETRNYVQRVVENAFVYDLMNPQGQPLAGPGLLFHRPGRGPLSERPNFITPAGFRALREEYEALYAGERPKLLETIAWAAANGDRSENADYQYGRRRLREIDRRINFLARRMKAAKVTDPAAQPDKSRVWFGATVTLADEEDERARRDPGRRGRGRCRRGPDQPRIAPRPRDPRRGGRRSFEPSGCPPARRTMR